MNTKSIKLGIDSFLNGIRKHDSEILIGTGIAGMIFGTVLAVKATPKALQLIEEKKAEEEKEKLEIVETVTTVWKCYLPVALIEIASVACLVCSAVKANKRNTALAMAYSLANNSLSEYQEKVKETIGEKKEQKIRDEIAKDQLANNPVENAKVEKTGDGDLLCWNGYSGGYFQSSPEAVGKGINEANDLLLHNEYISLNDFYDCLHLRCDTQIGNQLGWNRADGLIEVIKTYETATDGRPCLVITFRNPPEYYYYEPRCK